ncbi:MAG TPA: HAD-IA family hydrolase [Caulobacteraceae bacterium]|nr:HAD-IA family hydrolase [Caulobacteraceae bacterium]
MAIRALMVDVDGVLLRHPEAGGWAAHLERDLGLSPALLQSAFFAPHFDAVVRGQAGLHERLGPVLARIAPHLTSRRLADYWFEHDYHPDEALGSELARLRGGGLAVHLATVQEHERAHFLWTIKGLKGRFDAIHYAAELGCCKPEPTFYEAIEQRTALAPGEIAFIDDRQANIDAARTRGWRARLWTGQERLADLLPELFDAPGPAAATPGA